MRLAVPVRILLFSILLLVPGCGGSEPGPDVTYADGGKTAIVELEGKRYELRCGGENPPVPFTYSFEDDCEINIVYQGRVYDFDSPYDTEELFKFKQKKRKKRSYRKKRRR